MVSDLRATKAQIKGHLVKKIKLSIIALLAITSLGYTGGDISPITEYELEDAIVAEEEAYIEPEPIVVEPEPIVVEPEPVVVEPKPKKNISTNGFYAGLGITGTRYKDSCLCKATTTNDKTTIKSQQFGVMAKVGYDFNQYIGIEARGSKTNISNEQAGVEHVGVFVKPMLPVGNSANIYGLIGAARTNAKASDFKYKTDSLALGAGIEIDLSKDTPKDGRYSRDFDGQGDQEKGVGLFVDYERMIVKKHAPVLDAISAGITYDF